MVAGGLRLGSYRAAGCREIGPPVKVEPSEVFWIPLASRSIDTGAARRSADKAWVVAADIVQKQSEVAAVDQSEQCGPILVGEPRVPWAGIHFVSDFPHVRRRGLILVFYLRWLANSSMSGIGHNRHPTGQQRQLPPPAISATPEATGQASPAG